MLQTIAQWVSIFPPEVAVFLVAMTPVLEQRVAIPLAVVIYNMSVWKAYTLTMLGNIGPVLLLSYFAHGFHTWIHNNPTHFFGKRFIAELKRAQDNFAKYEKYGLMGLALFVILPIPGSGIFTGAVLAFLMGVPFRRSWPYLVGAVLGSGIFTLIVSVGIEKLL